MKRLLLAMPLLLLLAGCSVSIEVRRAPKAYHEHASVCATCKGVGAVEDIIIRSAPPESGEEISRTITCPGCRGTGKVTK